MAPFLMVSGLMTLGLATGMRRGPRGAPAVSMQAAKKRKGKGEASKRTTDVDKFDSGAGQYSFISGLAAADQEEAQDKEAAEKEAALLEEEMTGLTGDDVVAVDAGEEMSAEEAARRGERQVTYTLLPSKKYVSFLAVQNAVRTWTKDGPDGRNRGCIEVQVAVITEKIRTLVIHVRENIHDFKNRTALVSLVALRRRLLDKLSWKDIDAYLKLRDSLKIRHVYRMEALIGRLPAYKYADEWRKPAPGKKTAMRLKKSQRLMQRRLANQLRQGKPAKVVQTTQKRVNARRWNGNEADEMRALIRGIAPPEKVDPLNLP